MRLTIDDLRVELAGRQVVAGVHVIVGAGETAALVGPNGSGKSTVLRTVYRHLRPAAGRVLADGDDIWRRPAQVTARRVAALPQERAAGFNLAVRDVVAAGRTPYKRAFARDDRRDRAIVQAALERVAMADQAHRPFTALSGGERQRVLLARALAQDPEVLVLDEPTNHLDIRHQVELLALIREQRRTTLLALHDLNTAAAVCDRLHVIDGGRIVASGPPRDVLTPALLGRVFGVRATVLCHPHTGGPLVVFDRKM